MMRQFRSQRRLTGWGVSIGFHALLLLAFLTSKPGQFVAAAGDDQGAMAVTMVSASQLRPSESPEAIEASGGLQPLLARFNPQVAPVIAAPAPGPVSDLLSRLQKQASLTHTVSPTDRRQAREAESAISDRALAKTETAANGSNSDPGAAGSPAALWGAMEPCWRKLKLANSRPVTLSVALDVQGRIAKPPQIVRSGSAPDEPQLKSEAWALQGLIACIPHNGVRFGGRTYQLVFPASGAS